MTVTRIACIAGLLILAGTAAGVLVGVLREHGISHALDWSTG